MNRNVEVFEEDGLMYMRNLTGQIKYEIIGENKAVVYIKLLMKAELFEE